MYSLNRLVIIREQILPRKQHARYLRTQQYAQGDGKHSHSSEDGIGADPFASIIVNSTHRNTPFQYLYHILEGAFFLPKAFGYYKQFTNL